MFLLSLLPDVSKLSEDNLRILKIKSMMLLDDILIQQKRETVGRTQTVASQITENLEKLQVRKGLRARTELTARHINFQIEKMKVSLAAQTLSASMPRHYERITTPRYEIEDLRRAIQDVRSKQLTLGKAAIKYSVPKATLFKQVNQEVFKEPKIGRLKTSGERGVTTTIVCAVSGIYVPPMFIFKRKRMSELLLKGCNSDMIATVSVSGWINEFIFVDYLQHFISFVKPTKEEPVLIILDNHESHISLEAYKLYREHNLHVLSLPPHVSHKMQPLDLTFFSSLKMAYNRECELYMVNNPGKRITQYEVGELVTNAYNKTANISKVVSGFRVAGIHPIDTDKFKECFENMLLDESNVSQTQKSSISVSETAAEQSLSELIDRLTLHEAIAMLETTNVALWRPILPYFHQTIGVEISLTKMIIYQAASSEFRQRNTRKSNEFDEEDEIPLADLMRNTTEKTQMN
ncbi:hypothetical protein ILUMI_10688 [Ignelater luminosus]|uniref:BESS domain-containing protein n=1 Tax=Ignelater luminosus TaxID=2038154 RepID=A0A8K0GB84_IGNLU|nr:hypothetical protein ILUMI_10688 [Ignelater luminosus]